MVFSLRTVFVATAFLAVFALALMYADSTWISVSSTATYALLVLAILGAAHCSPPWRTFWNGFAVFGWAYLLLTADVVDFVGRHNFLTTVALDAVHGQIAHYRELPRNQSPGDPETGRILGTRQDGSNIYAVPAPSRGAFRTVGHYFFAMISGVLGGLLALRFSRVKRNSDRQRE